MWNACVRFWRLHRFARGIFLRSLLPIKRRRNACQIGKYAGEEIAASVNASTFHSACVRILRRSITLLGYDSDFAIYDADDARRLMKNCLSDVNVSEKQFPPAV